MLVDTGVMVSRQLQVHILYKKICMSITQQRVFDFMFKTHRQYFLSACLISFALRFLFLINETLPLPPTSPCVTGQGFMDCSMDTCLRREFAMAHHENLGMVSPKITDTTQMHFDTHGITYIYLNVHWDNYPYDYDMLRVCAHLKKAYIYVWAGCCILSTFQSHLHER